MVLSVQDFRPKLCVYFSVLSCPDYLIAFDLTSVLGEDYKVRSSSLCAACTPFVTVRLSDPDFLTQVFSNTAVDAAS